MLANLTGDREDVHALVFKILNIAYSTTFSFLYLSVNSSRADQIEIVTQES